MELSEPVVVDVTGRWPPWYRRCVDNMNIYRPELSYWDQVQLMKLWWRTHYDAELKTPYIETLTFPNQSRYLECILTWS